MKYTKEINNPEIKKSFVSKNKREKDINTNIMVFDTKLAKLEKSNNYLVDRIDRLKTNSLDLDFLDEKIRENTGFLDSDEILIKFK